MTSFSASRKLASVPPLRERADDIPALVRHMFAAEGKATAFKRVSPESLARLVRYDWPGNVRELLNAVRLALAYDRGGEVDVSEHLMQADASRSAPAAARAGSTYTQSKERHDRTYFAALFEATAGNVSEMARQADLDRATVRAYLHRHRIDAARASRRRA